MSCDEGFTVAVDDRERRAGYWWDHVSIYSRLETGDYQIEQALGFSTKLVVVERKTKVDLYSCIGKSRSRFKRELRRMTEFAVQAVVVECTLEDFLAPPEHSHVSSSSALGSVTTWQMMHCIPFVFAGSAWLGKKVTMRILSKAWDMRSRLVGEN